MENYGKTTLNLIFGIFVSFCLFIQLFSRQKTCVILFFIHKEGSKSFLLSSPKFSGKCDLGKIIIVVT